MYTLTIEVFKEGAFTEKRVIGINDAQLQKLCENLNLDITFKEIPSFEDLGNLSIEDDFYNEITLSELFTEDGELVKNEHGYIVLARYLSDLDFDVDWDEDNEEVITSFKATIENKYAITFDIEQGDCIEATWEHRIFETDVVNIQVVEIL